MKAIKKKNSSRLRRQKVEAGRSDSPALLFQKTRLSNGVRVVSEFHPHVQSVSIGVWVLTGTRDEPASQVGVSHFLEHLVFKGTRKRSAYQIARSLEEVGGELNAFTTREYTCYHATVLKRDWRLALDVLSDLTNNMQITANDFEKERSVVLEEILMSADDPEDLAYDRFLRQAFPSHPLGRVILGTEKTLKSLTLRQVMDYYRARYGGENLVISAAGFINHEEFTEEVDHLFGRKAARGRGNVPRPARRKPEMASFAEAIKKPTEQLHLLMGVPCPSFQDPLRFASFLINAWLGGGMTSHLYQKVREKRGLVYSIYSALHTFTDSGMMNIGASAHPAKMPDVLEEVFKTMSRLREKGMSRKEIHFYQRQIEGSLRIGAEDIENRMNSLAINEMVFGAYRPVEQVIDEIKSVTEKEVNRALNQWREEDLGLLLVGANAEDVLTWWKSERSAGRLKLD